MRFPARWMVLVLAISGIAWGVSRALDKRTQQQTEAQKTVGTAQTQRVLRPGPGDVWQAQTGTLTQTLPFTGTLKAVHSATVKARVAGVVQGLRVREGEHVSAGQLLARIDASDAHARLQQAEQQLQASQAQWALAQRQHENNQALVAQRFISATATLGSQTTLETARANWQTAQAALEIARKGVSDTEVRAPIGGQISVRSVQDGERVAVDARLLDLVDARQQEIEINLPPTAAARLRIGQKAQWSVDGQAQTGTAQVARVNPSLQNGSRSVVAYLSLSRPTPLPLGVFVEGRLQIGELRGTGVAVPLGAVRHDQPVPYLQWVQDGKVAHLPLPDTPAQGEVQGQPMVWIQGLPNGSTVLLPSIGRVAVGTAIELPSTVTQP